MSASTQNQALNALLFLYKGVLEKKIGLIQGVVRANRPKRLPVVLTKEEVKRTLEHLENTPWLIAVLLYGSGLRLLECCHLRVKDVDFSRNQIVIRTGKGNKDRNTMLPGAVAEPLRKHLQAVKRQHEDDFKKGLGRVALPDALERKYPSAGIIFTKQLYRKLSKKRGLRRVSSNRLAATLCVIPLPPIWSKRGTISGLFRSCLDTMTSKRR